MADIFDTDHCYCCGRTEFELQEARTTCCKDYVCSGAYWQTFDVAKTRWSPRCGQVEACCAAGAFVMTWWDGLFDPEKMDEGSATCEHGIFNPEQYALMQRGRAA